MIWKWNCIGDHKHERLVLSPQILEGKGLGFQGFRAVGGFGLFKPQKLGLRGLG